MTISIRDARPEDAETILRFITELAIYEKEPDAVEATVEMLQASLFGPGAITRAVICEKDGKPAGFAMWFYNYSTWQARKGLYLEDVDANKYPPDTSPREWKVYCLDLKSGDIIWEKVAHTGVPAKPHHLKNTLASETPATDGERVYASFGNVGLYCYDFDGNQLWSRPFDAHETRYGWGTSISPIVHQGRVIGVVYLENQARV